MPQEPFSDAYGGSADAGRGALGDGAGLVEDGAFGLRVRVVVLTAAVPGPAGTPS